MRLPNDVFLSRIRMRDLALRIDRDKYEQRDMQMKSKHTQWHLEQTNKLSLISLNNIHQ